MDPDGAEGRDRRRAAAVEDLKARMRKVGLEPGGCVGGADLRRRYRARLQEEEWPFLVRRLSDRVWVVVESDRFGEQPHIYVVRGRKKAILVDTGCGSANLRDFLWTLPELDGLEFQVVNTHVHYDHIGGNHCFCGAGGAALCAECVAICQGARDRGFSERWRDSSLQSMVGASIDNFCVTEWLEEGDRIYLDDDMPSDEEALEVLYTPGHTPDSISLYLPIENRLFTGDLIYPGALYLFLPGSSFPEFAESLEKLRRFIAARPPGVRLACGHIEAELPSAQLGEIHSLLDEIRAKRARPRIARVPLSASPLALFETQHFTLMCRTEDVS